MESTACARKDRAQEQPLTPPEPGDTAPGTRALRDFRDPKGKSAPANRGPRLAGWLGWPKVEKIRKNMIFFRKNMFFKFCLGMF